MLRPLPTNNEEPYVAGTMSNARHYPPAHNCATDKFTMRGTLIRVGCMPLLARLELHAVELSGESEWLEGVW